MKKAKVLYLDIETSRMILRHPSYTLYDIKRVDPKYIEHDWYITCAAWARIDPVKRKIGRIYSVKGSDFSVYKKDFRNDLGAVKALHKVISEADLIVGHNVDSFDIKKINERVVRHGLSPLPTVPSVDTLKVNKKYRKSSSNSLAFIAKTLGVTEKVPLPSSVMWSADEGCEASLQKLERYCKGDVKAGAEVYLKLLDHTHNHPSLSRIVGVQAKPYSDEFCPTCQSSDLVKTGLSKSKTGLRQKYRCKSCLTYFRGALIKK